MKGVSTSRDPSFRSRHATGATRRRQTRGRGEDARDGTASTRRARRTMAPAKKGARARARRNLCRAFVAFVARVRRNDGARATEDSREGFATDDDG